MSKEPRHVRVAVTAREANDPAALLALVLDRLKEKSVSVEMVFASEPVTQAEVEPTATEPAPRGRFSSFLRGLGQSLVVFPPPVRLRRGGDLDRLGEDWRTIGADLPTAIRKAHAEPPDATTADRAGA